MKQDNEPLYEQIEAFLTGQLAPGQREAMQKALLDDPELARAVELRRLEFDVSEALIAQNIRDQLHRLRTFSPPESSVRGFKFRPLLWLIAVMLTIAAIGVYWWKMQASRTVPTTEQSPSSAPEQTPSLQQEAPLSDPPRAGKEPGSPGRKNTGSPEDQSMRQQLAMATRLYQRPNMETLRGHAPAADDAYALALSAWEKQDYAAVITALQNFSTNDPKWMRALTLRAHAQFNLKRFTQAAQSFSVIANSQVRPWSEEADWYVLLALLADGKADTVAFRTRLEKLLSDEGHPYFEQAREVEAHLGR